MNSFVLFSILFINIFSKSAKVSADLTTVTITQGSVQGYYDWVDKYYSYYGIPFASYKGRFKESGDPSPFNGTFKANDRNAEVICKQFCPVRNSILGVEDCLTLNVYTPATNNTQNLPVIVFFHGGGFYWGRNIDSLYNPKYLLKKNVVVVNINYRVGTFGFLCLPIKDTAGNIGLTDQIAALKWVQNNIAEFGGNPDCVTIYGQNGGAISVNYLVLSRKADGLFNRVIMSSGSVLFPYAFDPDPTGTAVQVAARLGFKTTDPGELYRIFSNSSADAIVRASHGNPKNNALAQYIFRPCAESRLTQNPIIIDDPETLLKSSSSLPKLDMIFGYNNKEGIMWASEYDLEGLRGLDSNFSRALPANLKFKNRESKLSFIKEVKSNFFNNQPITYDGLIRYFSIALIKYPSIVNMEELLKNPRISMHNYEFGYSSFRNLNKQASRLIAVTGASDADDLFYCFADPLAYRYLYVFYEDRKIIDLCTSFLASFAKDGIPTTSANITWNKSEKTLQFLKIDKQSEMYSGLPKNGTYVKIWKSLIKKYTV